MKRTLVAGAITGLLTALPAQEPAAGTTRFTNLTRAFLIDLPGDFRQLAPNEALQLADAPSTPADWHSTAPRSFYAIGPVERWLDGEVGTPWLYVMEQDNEWHIENDFVKELTERWEKSGEATGVRHELRDIHMAKVGPQAHQVWRAHRTVTPRTGRPIRTIDIYAPTGGRQITLSLCAWADEFDHWQPSFEKWLTTLTFARQARGEQTLGDRLWTPILTGGIVGLALLLLYKHSKRTG